MDRQSGLSLHQQPPNRPPPSRIKSFVMKPFCTECATPGLQMFPHRNYPQGSKIDPFSETLNSSSRADCFRVTVQTCLVNLAIIYPHTELKRTMLPRVSAIHKEYFCIGILVDILVMQKIPRPTFTPSQLHNVGGDNGNAANRTKEYTKLQVAGQ